MFDLPVPATACPPDRNLHAARCSDGIAILDIKGDAYLSIYAPRPPGDSPRRDRETDPALVQRVLAESPLLVPSTGFQHSPGWSETPRWRALPVVSPSRPPLGATLSFLTALARTCILVRTRSFASLIEKAQRRYETSHPTSQHDLAQLVGWFDRLSLWLPVRPLCLFRSLMLLLFLRGRGLDAQWVFGVTLFPFQAHCWLAVDDILVGERVDRVEEFVVIFTTGRGAA